MRIYKLIVLLLIMIGLGVFVWNPVPASKNDFVKSMPTVLTRSIERVKEEPIIQSSRQLVEGHPTKASHPLVKFENPGEIRSFSDPKLGEAFNIYFSLIGEAKEKYPYSKSGFDTVQNATLAYTTIQKVDYSKTGNALKEELESAIQALTHLSHSALPESGEYRKALKEELIAKIKSESKMSKKQLYAEDLDLLLSSGQSLEALEQLRESQTDPTILATLGLVIEREREIQND